MTLDGRDRLIVQYVARFKQLAAQHVQELLFYDRTSTTPCNRALRRLVSKGYLRRIERRNVGGSHGGSGQYVYQLGKDGFYLHFSGRYEPRRAIQYHQLAIADCYVTLKQLERQGALHIAGVSTEPDCWVSVSGINLRPDMYVELLVLPAQPRWLWLEVDMGSEAQKRIRATLEEYARACDRLATEHAGWPWWFGERPVFPKVVFVAVDSERAAELTWLVSQIPERAKPLFEVTTRDKLASLLLS